MLKLHVSYLIKCFKSPLMQSIFFLLLAFCELNMENYVTINLTTCVWVWVSVWLANFVLWEVMLAAILQWVQWCGSKVGCYYLFNGLAIETSCYWWWFSSFNFSYCCSVLLWNIYFIVLMQKNNKTLYVTSDLLTHHGHLLNEFNGTLLHRFFVYATCSKVISSNTIHPEIYIYTQSTHGVFLWFGSSRFYPYPWRIIPLVPGLNCLVPEKLPFWIWVNTLHEPVWTDNMTIKQCRTRLCAYFMGCTLKKL